MKKGIIVEQKKRHTMMMTSDGSFYKTHKVGGSIGEETSFEPIVSPAISLDGIFKWMQSLTSFKPVAAALIAFLLIIPFYSWLGEEEDVHAYVNIDINPSVELSVNDDYEVIHVEGINDDGRSVVQQLSDWENQSIKNVSSNILNLSNQLGYLEEDHQILLGISFVNQLNNGDNHLVLQEVTKQMETDFQSVSVASFEVPKEIREEAKKTQASMNLMYASEILENRDGDANAKVSDSNEKQLEKEQTDRDSSETSADAPEHQSVTKSDNKNFEVIEKFIEKSNKDKMPPGLKKKLEKYKESQQSNDEEVEDIIENRERNSRNDEKGNSKSEDKGQDHPSNNGKNKGDDHPSNNEKNGITNNDEGTPPGHSKHDKQDNREEADSDDRGGFWDFFERGDKDKQNKERSKNKGQEDDRSFSPPGLDQKEDDHPGKQNRNND